ncbi:hypothetical protein EVAR_10417_1 [Eumeta japonica]|uniref:Uncharacterized protein n=1 Tax=Eumeta variegata TaxID=151549 RepID=A0A4C1UDI8_EUMVA|nr:hypothetical protein EVAR_10417_1 [Eumeta japonica]
MSFADLLDSFRKLERRARHRLRAAVQRPAPAHSFNNFNFPIKLLEVHTQKSCKKIQIMSRISNERSPQYTCSSWGRRPLARPRTPPTTGFRFQIFYKIQYLYRQTLIFLYID